MNKDKLYLLVFICVRVTCGERYLRQPGIQLRYSFSMENICHSDEDRFFLHQGLQFENCVKECALRIHCLQLNYNRRTQVCELFTTDGDEKQRKGDCVRVFKSDIEIIEIPAACNECVHGETCEIDENGDASCLVKECLSPGLANGDIKGNVKNVGMEIQYECAEGYKERTGVTKDVCLATGHWSKTVVCVEEGNIAKGKAATQSSTYSNSSDYSAQKAVDGNISPDSHCATTDKDKSDGWWEVDLGREYAVRRVKVLTRSSEENGSKFRNVYVTIGSTTDPTSYTSCTSYLRVADIGSIIDLECNQIINGRYVRISKNYTQSNDILPLCEVEVFLW